MEIEYGALHEPKEGYHADEYEDAFAYSDDTSAVAAVSDGDVVAFESGRWARLLAQGFVEDPPLGGTVDDLLGWVDLIAEQWSRSIPRADDYIEMMKARLGSAATLVGLQLIRLPERPANGTWRCLALGNSCLFQVSGGRLVEALPLGSSADFKVRPALLSTERSVNLKSVGQVVTKAGTWQEGDSFFLLTNAIAEWFLRESERGASPWEFLTSADEQLFRAFVQEMRGQRLMRDDDVTALVVGLGVPLRTRDIPVPVQPAPARQADRSPGRSRDASPPGSPATATTPGSPAPPRPSSRSEPAGRVGAAGDGGTQPAWWEAGLPRDEPPDPVQAVSPSAPAMRPPIPSPPPAHAAPRTRSGRRWSVRLWRAKRTRQKAPLIGGQPAPPTAPGSGRLPLSDLREGSSPASAGEVQPVEVNVSADMPSYVQVGKVASVACHVSRGEIEAVADRVSDKGHVAADAARMITLDLLPRVNAEAVGEDGAEVPVPSQGQTSDAYFDIRPTHAGKCQVWVVVRQGPVPLLTLRLEAAAALHQPAQPVGRQPVEARAGVGGTTGLEDASWLSVAEMDRGQDTVYRFDLQSTTLGILATYESPPLRHRAEYVANLYREIEDRWISSAGDVEAFQEELREFGGSLLSQLFPEQLQEILWRHRESLQNLIVLSCEPFIPWELVHLKEPGGPLPDETRFLAEMGLVRWLYTSGDAYPPETLHARPGRVRVLCPDYPDPDLHLSQTRGEAQFLADHLGGSMVAANEHDVRALLRAGSFDILHFAGHGIADSGDIANAKILLEGRRESGAYVQSYLSATAVAQQARLASPDGVKPLVVLNACQAGRLGQQMSSLGGFAQAFLDRGAGAFVSSMWSVGDEPASTFVKTLYRELLDQEPISAAVSKARQEARRAGDGTWLAYAVYANPRARLLIPASLSRVTSCRVPHRYPRGRTSGDRHGYQEQLTYGNLSDRPAAKAATQQVPNMDGFPVQARLRPTCMPPVAVKYRMTRSAWMSAAVRCRFSHCLGGSACVLKRPSRCRRPR